MANSKQVRKGGFPAKVRAGLVRVKLTLARLLNYIKTFKSRYQARKHIKNMKTKKQGITQAEAFVQSRNPGVQYAIDVLALAFVLAIIFTLINHWVK